VKTPQDKFKVMKKIFFLIFTFLIVCVGKNTAQSGFDFALVPFDYNKRADLDDNGRSYLYDGTHVGFKVGYFNWQTDNLMKTFSLQVTTIDKDFTYYNYSNNTNIIKENYSHNATSFLFKIGAIRVFNEIDSKSHGYFKNEFLFALRNDEVTFKNKEPFFDNPDLKNNFNPDYKDPLQFSFGYNVGFGYQYNIIEKLGLYGDVNIGFRFFEMMAFVNSNVGLRYRIN
jgi:hypothetical protein